MMDDLQYRCPDCGGDGKETCHNPDHGFIGAMGGEMARLGCPCCGHNRDYKMKGDCETCGGKGDVSWATFIEFVDNNDVGDIDASDYQKPIL